MSAPALCERFLFCTGGAVTPRAEAFMRAKGAQVLQKPVPLDDLRLMIHRLAEREVEVVGGDAG